MTEERICFSACYVGNIRTWIASIDFFPVLGLLINDDALPNFHQFGQFYKRQFNTRSHFLFQNRRSNLCKEEGENSACNLFQKAENPKASSWNRHGHSFTFEEYSKLTPAMAEDLQQVYMTLCFQHSKGVCILLIRLQKQFSLKMHIANNLGNIAPSKSSIRLSVT